MSDAVIDPQNLYTFVFGDTRASDLVTLAPVDLDLDHKIKDIVLLKQDELDRYVSLVNAAAQAVGQRTELSVVRTQLMAEIRSRYAAEQGG